MNKDALIIFQKNAVLGKVKTRLGASIGDVKALEVYNWLTFYTHEQVKGLKVDKFLFYSEFIPEHSSLDFPVYQFEIQSGNSLGNRMSKAFALLFEKGYKNVVIIGTDCPGLKTEDLYQAFLNLSQAGLVIGPAKDGGYYLIGMSQFIPEVFENIPWSTAAVLDKTLERANALKIKYEFLRTLADIDTLEDLEMFLLQTKPPIIE
jgi:rSAM/selenodomain-associated transferase 1